MTENQQEEVKQKIFEAFRHVQHPDHNSVFVASSEQYFDTQLASKQLGSLRWEDIPLEVLIKNRDRISFFTTVSYRFLLPAFLLAAINYPKVVDVLRENIIRSLTPPGEGLPYRLIFLDRASVFDHAQIEAILSFFESYTTLYPIEEWSYSVEDELNIEKAIDFWKKQLPLS